MTVVSRRAWPLDDWPTVRVRVLIDVPASPSAGSPPAAGTVSASAESTLTYPVPVDVNDLAQAGREAADAAARAFLRRNAALFAETLGR